MIEAHAVPIPSDSVLEPLYMGADLLDAFAIHLVALHPQPAGHLP